jgi:hypothetical protein
MTKLDDKDLEKVAGGSSRQDVDADTPPSSLSRWTIEPVEDPPSGSGGPGPETEADSEGLQEL